MFGRLRSLIALRDFSANQILVSAKHRQGDDLRRARLLFAFPFWLPTVEVQTRKVGHKREYIRLLKCRYFFRRLDWNQSCILLVVAVLPIDPLIPLMEIELAAFQALVQRACQVTGILVGFHLFKESRKFARYALGMLPQNTLSGMAQLDNPCRLSISHTVILSVVGGYRAMRRGGLR